MRTTKSARGLSLVCVGVLLHLGLGEHLGAQSGVLLGVATPGVDAGVDADRSLVSYGADVAEHLSMRSERYSEACSMSGWHRRARIDLYRIVRPSGEADASLEEVDLEGLVGPAVEAAVDTGLHGQPDRDVCEIDSGLGIGRVPAQSRVVDRNDLAPGLNDLRALIPGVRDAVSSPGRDLVVAVTADGVVAIRVTDGRLGEPRPLATLTGDIIMAEWAVGPSVAGWTEEVRVLLGVEEERPGGSATAKVVYPVGGIEHE